MIISSQLVANCQKTSERTIWLESLPAANAAFGQAAARLAALGRDVLSPYLDQALAMTDDERSARLSSLAEGNPALAAEVRALLDEHRILAQEGFPEKGPAVLPSAAGLAGQTVGPYTLISQIGQGGTPSTTANSSKSARCCFSRGCGSFPTQHG
jgi:hypothetical protein